MKATLALGFLLVSLAYVMAGESSFSPKDTESIDKYRDMLNSFETKVKRIYRELHNKAFADKEFVNNKLEGSMAAVRAKRDTETPDIQGQINSAFKNLQKMFDDAKNSDSAKLFMDKLNEFGTNLQGAGKQLTEKVQETIQQISTKPEATS